MSMKPSTRIVKFVVPGSGVQAPQQSQYGHILVVKMCQVLESLLHHFQSSGR